VALVDSVQQGHDMLANELFALKPGTFIKGFDILPSDSWSGRKALLSTKGWNNTSDYNLLNVRSVLFVVKPNLLSGEDCINATKKNYAWDDYKSDLFDDHEETSLISFKENQPIGIHLGEFKISKTNIYTVYTKMLLCSGNIGMLGLTTTKLNEPLELL
jgi:hypothetical protein